MRKTIHQGDVLLIPINKIPQDAKKLRMDIVQYGEVTGHSHKIEGCIVYGDENRATHISVPISKPMTHEDHPSASVEAGVYEVKIQQEYFPDGFRDIKD